MEDKMNIRAKKVFLIEIDHQCDYAIYAAKGMQEAIDNHEIKTFWFYTQALLNSSANISKLLWGTSEEYYEKRKEFRKSLGIRNSSPLKSRKIRNAFEHFDEKLDVWASSTEKFVDSNIGPTHMYGGIEPTDHLRFFDTEEISISFKGDKFKVHPIMEAIDHLKKVVTEEFNKIEVEH